MAVIKIKTIKKNLQAVVNYAKKWRKYNKSVAENDKSNVLKN